MTPKQLALQAQLQDASLSPERRTELKAMLASITDGPSKIQSLFEEIRDKLNEILERLPKHPGKKHKQPETDDIL